MARFCGSIGYATQEEIRPGVFAPNHIREIPYTGDVKDMRFSNASADKINNDLTTSDVISIVGDPFAFENFSNIRYVVYMGVRWKVSNVSIQRPRLILTLGGIYNGDI